MNHPVVFEPLFMERVWGDRQLEKLYGKRLPQGARIGESWEVVDREEAQSVVHAGALRGATLHELWTHRRAEIFGEKFAAHPSPRFPLLLKLLDCRDRLSVQVHPPASVAAKLGGEPKTEMWYVAHAQDGADIFAGLKNGVTREEFEKALHDGHVAEKIHRIETKAGDVIFIPSGRIHAIGAGNVIVEIQQNSDTTYRVFDWNRVGLNGKPRELHISESMQSIDLADFEPPLATPQGEVVCECEFFRVEKWELEKARVACADGAFAIFTCLTGEIECAGSHFKPGEFFIVPAMLAGGQVAPCGGSATLLRITLPV